MAKIVKEDVDRFHDYGIHAASRTIYLGSFAYSDDGGENGVDFAMAERFIKNLTLLDRTNAEPITVIMNNPGGDWFHGIAIYDAIINARSHITIKVYGMAMSMGAVILQAADERVMAPNAKFMIHYGTMGMNSTHAKIFQKWAAEDEKCNQTMESIFLNRIHQKHPDFKLKKLQELLNFDTIMTAKETVTYGMADSILGEGEENE